MLKKRLKRGLINYILFVLILILFIYSIWLFASRPLKTEIVNVKFEVGDNLGFSVNTDSLDFGRLVPGSSNSRNLDIENTYNFPVNLKIYAGKNIKDFLIVEQGIKIDSKDKTKVSVTLEVPEDMAYGNYSGKIKFEFRKA